MDHGPSCAARDASQVADPHVDQCQAHSGIRCISGLIDFDLPRLPRPIRHTLLICVSTASHSPPRAPQITHSMPSSQSSLPSKCPRPSRMMLAPHIAPCSTPKRGPHPTRTNKDVPRSHSGPRNAPLCTRNTLSGPPCTVASRSTPSSDGLECRVSPMHHAELVAMCTHSAHLANRDTGGSRG